MKNLGISGHLTKAFLRSPLTPLFLLASVALGVVALMALPREEEPQISVPLVDILVDANGLKAPDVVELVTKPLEDIVKGVNNVEHVYSMSQDDQVMVTARFDVGTDEDVAILRVHDAIRANIGHIPVGIPDPLIIGRGINDVPIVTITLAPRGIDAGRWNDNALYNIAEELMHELAKVENVGLTFFVGGRADQIRVEPDPELLSLYGVTLEQLIGKVESANRSFRVGRVRDGGKAVSVMAGQTLIGMPDVGLLMITARDGRPVYVKDVANVVVGAKPEEHRVWHMTKSDVDGATLDAKPAVTLAIAKRKGANAVLVADEITHRLELVKGSLLPADVEATITRNYGETALEKSDELLFHLGLATISIVVLVGWALGWREGIVVMVVVPTTILMTLFAAYMMDFTINRVSLFALIFSIGILVDDAIVVVENIVRHWSMKDGRSPMRATVEAVAEVGNPTIIATLTIVAALLPMMFVSGLMGPYMSPIPANASAAMVFSFFVAMIITPWLLCKITCWRKKMPEDVLMDDDADFTDPVDMGNHADHGPGVLGNFYKRIATKLLTGRKNSIRLLVVTGIATLASLVLFATKDVTVKLLPFDNKSELQVVVDLPEGSTLESTERVVLDVANRIKALPELVSMQAYVGTAMPFNFNGLVRHYYLRSEPWQGELQINLAAKQDRDRQSHDVALNVRTLLDGLDVPPGTSVKVVEVPPGPPVMATLMAEIYGPDPETRRAAAAKVRKAFESVEFVADVDDSYGQPETRVRLEIDQENLEFHGVKEGDLFDTIQAIIGGKTVGYSQRGEGVNPIEIAIRLPKEGLAMGERILSTPVSAPGPAGDSGRVVELGDVVSLVREQASYPMYRRDGHFAELVTGEMAGQFEAPIYGMFAVKDKLDAMDWGPDGAPTIAYHGQPKDESKVTLLWDGEWEVTYITFRDMGLAFVFALLGIYLLVVGQFGSFKLPLVILTPVPLTLIGIMFGHWIFGAPFSATSMIGFIALAGIIVRNSILLVDFIKQRQVSGKPLRDVLIEAGTIRFKPIFLTAVAAMIGSAFILADPIFQGLAISMVFGLASSTALTLLVIPAIYVVLRDDGRDIKDGK
ncbi:efflux RND transporter permease subunit [Magnetovibrio blakemorei]|uniref:Multidrug transporter AcrB n=1 Tax=Magnetovibrio blakemorei TaxID=28181 RepID=A0A1E5Q9N7_9PROT|nr:efflux RND transporter permease subunit [Magnetovibrio blakemorei]OEJ68405.1 multidrug transporter AcrB [Magnetovibrio blakemorei]